MMVSDKIIEACKDTAYAYGAGNITIDIENAQETAQGAWRPNSLRLQLTPTPQT